MAAIAADASYPYDGENAFEDQWRDMFRALGSGVVAGLDNELAVFGDSSGRQVKLPTGRIWAAGQFGKITAQKTLAIATNTSGQPRIDRVIARNRFGTQIEFDVLTGTPGASPSPPALTSNGSLQEFSLAQVGPLASGFTTVAATDVHNEALYVSLFGPPAIGAASVSPSLWLTAKLGMMLSARDTGALWLYDGTSWVQQRRELDPFSFTPAGNDDLNGASFAIWPTGLHTSVAVPKWATKARLFAKIGNLLAVTSTLQHQVNLALGASAADSTGQLTWAVDGVFHDIVLAGTIDCTSVAGTSQTLQTVGIRGGGSGALRASSASSCYLEVQFS